MNRGNPSLVPRLWRFDPERSTAELVMLGGAAPLRARFHTVSGGATVQVAVPHPMEIEVRIDTRDFIADDCRRMAVLASSEFLDTGQHAELSLRSRRVETESNGELRILGDLRFRGFRRLVMLACEGQRIPVESSSGEGLQIRVRGAFEAGDFGLLPASATRSLGFGATCLLELRVDAVATPLDPGPQAARRYTLRRCHGVAPRGSRKHATDSRHRQPGIHG